MLLGTFCGLQGQFYFKLKVSLFLEVESKSNPLKNSDRKSPLHTGERTLGTSLDFMRDKDTLPWGMDKGEVITLKFA